MSNSSSSSSTGRITVPHLLARKQKGRSGADLPPKIAALTAYDYTTARLLDRAGVDVLLVGDSLAGTVQGLDTTIPVTLEDVIYHTRAVVRGTSRALVVADMPFLTYQVSPEQAVMSAGRLLKEGGAQAVKLEGGLPVAKAIEQIAKYDIPVMGHVGLTPQSYHRMGGHRVQGRKHGESNEAGTRERIIADARAVEDAGAFSVVLEGIPMELAEEITETLSIPTIGIGAGAACDGQILVINDLLGLNPEFSPRFVKRYVELGTEIIKATESYISEVRSGAFPSAAHGWSERAEPVKPITRAGER